MADLVLYAKVKDLDPERRLSLEWTYYYNTNLYRFRIIGDETSGLLEAEFASLTAMMAALVPPAVLRGAHDPSDRVNAWLETVLQARRQPVTEVFTGINESTGVEETYIRSVVKGICRVSAALFYKVAVRDADNQERVRLAAAMTELEAADPGSRPDTDVTQVMQSTPGLPGGTLNPPKGAAATITKQFRAKTVAKLIRELDGLRPQIFEDEEEYKALRTRHPDFLTFKIADARPDLKMKILAIRGSRQHIRLAQELAAAHHGKQLSTIQDDWKDHKPPEFKRSVTT